MKQQQRYDLRMKHQDWSGHCPVCHTETACDVINVLDAWEASLFECEHEIVYMGDNGLPRHPLSGAYFNYCPTCGVKV